MSSGLKFEALAQYRLGEITFEQLVETVTPVDLKYIVMDEYFVRYLASSVADASREWVVASVNGAWNRQFPAPGNGRQARRDHRVREEARARLNEDRAALDQARRGLWEIDKDIIPRMVKEALVALPAEVSTDADRIHDVLVQLLLAADPEMGDEQAATRADEWVARLQQATQDTQAGAAVILEIARIVRAAVSAQTEPKSAASSNPDAALGLAVLEAELKLLAARRQRARVLASIDAAPQEIVRLPGKIAAATQQGEDVKSLEQQLGTNRRLVQEPARVLATATKAVAAAEAALTAAKVALIGGESELGRQLTAALAAVAEAEAALYSTAEAEAVRQAHAAFEAARVASTAAVAEAALDQTGEAARVAEAAAELEAARVALDQTGEAEAVRQAQKVLAGLLKQLDECCAPMLRPAERTSAGVELLEQMNEYADALEDETADAPGRVPKSRSVMRAAGVGSAPTTRERARAEVRAVVSERDRIARRLDAAKRDCHRFLRIRKALGRLTPWEVKDLMDMAFYEEGVGSGGR